MGKIRRFSLRFQNPVILKEPSCMSGEVFNEELARFICNPHSPGLLSASRFFFSCFQRFRLLSPSRNYFHPLIIVVVVGTKARVNCMKKED